MGKIRVRSAGIGVLTLTQMSPIKLVIVQLVTSGERRLYQELRQRNPDMPALADSDMITSTSEHGNALFDEMQRIGAFHFDLVMWRARAQSRRLNRNDATRQAWYDHRDRGEVYHRGDDLGHRGWY